jgi:ABC-2 type transport system permease protein
MSRPGDVSGVIHDIGYQRYSGPRLGRRYVARSMYVHSLRTAFGLGRGVRTKILPVGLFAVVCVVALILVVISTRLPRPVLGYVDMVTTFATVAALFVAVVGPELVSRDLRNNLLSLYFSRPLTRMDYGLAKLAGLATAVFALFAGPMLIMFVGMVLSGKTDIAAEAGRFLLGLLAAAIGAVLFAAIAAPLAALTGRRVFATGMIIALFLLTTPIVAVLGAIGTGSLAELAGLFNPVSLLGGVNRWLFGATGPNVGNYGPVYGLVTIAVAGVGVGLMLWRCREVRA